MVKPLYQKGWRVFNFHLTLQNEYWLSEEIALAALDEFEAKWGQKYPLGGKNWCVNWNELSTMFKYPLEIRKLIYITNAIENFNRQLRKVTKTKSAFVSDDALMKILYLTTMQILDKWTMPIFD